MRQPVCWRGVQSTKRSALSAASNDNFPHDHTGHKVPDVVIKHSLVEVFETMN